MHKLITWCGLLAAFMTLAGATGSAQGVAGEQSDTADIRRLESTFFEALHARDRPRLESLLAADYVLRAAPDVDRKTWLRNGMTLCWGERSDIDRFRAQRHDDVAIAFFELTFYVDPGSCQPAVLRSLVTDVWVRDSEGWKLKVRHAGAPAQGGDIAAQYGVVPVLPPTWEAGSELSAVATGGNTSTRTLGMGFQLVHRADRQKTEANTQFLTSRADGVTNARSLTVDGRHGFAMTPQLQMFGQASYARDRFAGIDDRTTVTAGMAYTLPGPPSQSLTLEAGFGWTGERRLDLAVFRFATATGALDYNWTIGPGTELRDEAAIFADLESASNWRTSNTLSLSVGFTRALSLRASQSIDYRRTPVPGFGGSDMRTAVALVFSTARRQPVR